MIIIKRRVNTLFLFVFIIKTISIEVKVVPKLNNDKGLELKIKEVKFLDLKIANWIVNLGISSFIKDWFFNMTIDLCKKINKIN
nr:hypothetical protein [uncultured Romboutsia sp.]